MQPFEFVPQRYGLPMVVSGFEPTDIMQSIVMILRQLDEGRPAVENQHARVVRAQGNAGALAALAQPWSCARISNGAVSASFHTVR